MIARASSIAALRAAADHLDSRRVDTRQSPMEWHNLRIESAQVSLRLLASLAEHHTASPPDYEDSLSDLSPYHWQRVVSDRRGERQSLIPSSFASVVEAGP